MRVGRLADGLWWWSCPHPAWEPGDNWDAEVVCAYAELPDATVVIDPLVPSEPGEAARFLDHLDRDVERRGLPVAVLVTHEWHLRSAPELGRRYGARVWAPAADERLDGCDRVVMRDGDRPARGITVHDLGSPAGEFAVAVEHHAAVVFGDIVAGGDAGPRLAPAAWYDDTAELEAWYRGEAPRRVARLLGPPTRFVICGHGDPVERRADGTWPAGTPGEPGPAPDAA